MKQAIVVRSDLKMSRGKLAVQVAHAAVSAAERVAKAKLKEWRKAGQKKIVLKVRNADELVKLREKCKKLGIAHYLVADAGLTELTPGEITCLGIGPDEENKIDKIIGSLPLLK